MRIVGLLVMLPALALAQKPGVDEILDRVAETYDHLNHYQFELREHPPERSVKFAAILPEKFFLQTFPGDARCITDGDTTWRFFPKSRRPGPTTMRPASGPEEKAICEQELAGAGNAFVDRWKKISDWAPQAAIRREASLRAGGSKADCWVIEIHDKTGGRITLWIDKARYLVLRETFSNPSQRIKIERNWIKAKVDAAPDDALFVPTLPSGIEYRYETVGKPAPDFTFTDIGGNRVALSSLHGKVVLLYFWPTYSARPEGYDPLGMIETLYADPLYQDMQFVGVIPVKPDALHDYLQRNRVRIPAAADLDKKIRAAYQTGKDPDVILIGPDGLVVRDFQGVLHESEIRRAIEDIL